MKIRWLSVSILLLLTVALAPRAPVDAAAGHWPVIGGFDLARGGGFAVPDGGFMTNVAGSLLANIGVTFTTFSTVTDGALAGVDIVILAAPFTDQGAAIAPLSAAEQTALSDFVVGGGCAVLFGENSAGYTAASNTLLAPFGMAVTGNTNHAHLALVPDPFVSPVTNGPHGVVNQFGQGWAAWFSNSGTATVLATNPGGDTLAVIGHDGLAPGSGPVIAFTDINGFIGLGTDEEALLLNVVDYCLPPIDADIDVKPGSAGNPINPKSNGKVPVAVMTTDHLDAGELDGTTLRFGPGMAVPAHDLSDPVVWADHRRDVDGDGDVDLIAHFVQKQTGLVAGDTEACLTGSTLGGRAIEGCDAVAVK